MNDEEEVPNDPSVLDGSDDDPVTYDGAANNDGPIAYSDSPSVNLPVVVGIGASAGGLEAFEDFFKALSPHSGMAYVVIQHLDPHHISILTDLIQRYTDIPVKQAANDMMVEADTIYVIPSSTMLGLFNGTLQLFGPTQNMRIRLPIDYFFRSLARDLREQAVAIVLSGTGSDGALGLKAVKEAGGMVMVQDPASAAYDGMPRSAIATGMVDFILRPDAMPHQLTLYWKLAPSMNKSPHTVRQQKPMSDSIQQILFMIRTQTEHDFSNYKQSTIRRRIERLMAVNQIENIADYVRFLQNNTIGVEMLFRDLLIGVTNFFRDKDSFEALRQTVIPQLFHNRRTDQPIRIWVPGCSTGEEAYSIAILIREHMKMLRQEFRVQIFATDLDQVAVNTARLGIYPANIESDIPEEYLHQYFLPKPEGGYQVVKSLREMLIFAPHSVTKDPPFSKIDLISCRNLLIYLEADLQDKVLSYFHFALVPMGFLFLGTSESLGRHEAEFKVIENQHKIFQRPQGISNLRFKPDMPFMVPRPEKDGSHVTHSQPTMTLRNMTENMLLNQWTPTCVIVNHQGHMRYVHGRTGKYLEISPGEMDQLDIVRAARNGLKEPLKTAIYRAVSQQREIYEPNIELYGENHGHVVNLTVRPITESPVGENLLAVFFEEIRSIDLGIDTADADGLSGSDERDQKYQLLMQELNDTRAYLQATIEELKSSNEEMQSINEELQSVNEELETSQEELKAVNEELLTINTELEEKIEEVTWANNDLSNTLNALQTGIILLDSDFQIRRFNPAATQVFKLIQGDIGRPIMHVVSEFDYPNLLEEAQKVFNTLVPLELDMQTRDGRWFAVQIRPYRTLQNAIKGVVLYFNDVTARKGR